MNLTDLLRAAIVTSLGLMASPCWADDPPKPAPPAVDEPADDDPDEPEEPADEFRAGTEWTGIYGTTRVDPKTRQVVRTSTDLRIVVTVREGERFWGEVWINSGLAGGEIQGEIGTKGRQKGRVQFTVTKVLTTTQASNIVGNLKATGQLKETILNGNVRVSQAATEGKFAVERKRTD